MTPGQNPKGGGPQAEMVVQTSADIFIVIPCFNAVVTIGETIESTQQQGQVEYGVIVVDDGSTDGSLSVARTFDSVTTVIEGPHWGVSAARNRGITETRSEWIVFLDADDSLLPGTLQRRLETARATNADVIICDWQDQIETGDGTVTGAIRSVDMNVLAADAEIACATTVWVTTAALMYRRTLVEKIGGFRDDLPIIQDARFLFDAAHLGARFAYSPHIGARYRVQAGSLSRRDPARFWRDVLVNGKQIEALWRARSPLSTTQLEALRGIYDHAGRGLLAAAHSDYFEAVSCQRSLGLQPTLHSRIATPLARAVGLRPARQLLRMAGR